MSLSRIDADRPSEETGIARKEDAHADHLRNGRTTGAVGAIWAKSHGNTRRAWEGSMEAIVSLAAVFVPALLVFGIVYLVELVRFYRAAAAQRRDNG